SIKFQATLRLQQSAAISISPSSQTVNRLQLDQGSLTGFFTLRQFSSWSSFFLSLQPRNWGTVYCLNASLSTVCSSTVVFLLSYLKGSYHYYFVWFSIFRLWISYHIALSFSSFLFDFVFFPFVVSMAVEALPNSVVAQGYVVEFADDDVPDDHIQTAQSLIGRIFWPMPKSLHHVLQAMARQWRISPTDLQLFDVGHGLLQFVFSTMEIKLRVYQTQPWAYKSAIMHLVPWEAPSQALFDRLQFMPLVVQLMDLPRQCNSVKFAIKLVRPLGDLIKADMYSTRPGGQGQHFVKCAIRIDLLRSIQGRIQAITPRHLPFWVKLRYEDLPAVCFACGLLGHGHRNCPYLALLPNISEERGHWMMTKPFGYKVKAVDYSEASTSKQKPKHLKPIPYVFHTMVNAEGVPISDIGQSSGASSLICEAPITPPIHDLHVLNLSDKKRPRLEDDDEASSPRCPKKQKIIPELTIDDFPEHALDLELLPEDIMDGADISDALISPTVLPTSLGSEVRLQGPPAPG
ncbi:hypothetical protein LINGRAHAP2_LOCUS14174, partial [Linum grandiflorum]